MVFHGKTTSSFSPEFKQEAASLVLNQGYSISEAGKSLGVDANELKRLPLS